MEGLYPARIGAGHAEHEAVQCQLIADFRQMAHGLGDQATGLGGERAGQLLKILAPIVLAFIAQRMSQGGAQNNPLGLAEVLGQEQRQVQQQGGLGGGLLGAVLDQDGDGQLGLGDILKIGSGMFGGGR